MALAGEDAAKEESDVLNKRLKVATASPALSSIRLSYRLIVRSLSCCYRPRRRPYRPQIQ
jgi:hypothetical protein